MYLSFRHYNNVTVPMAFCMSSCGLHGRQSALTSETISSITNQFMPSPADFLRRMVIPLPTTSASSCQSEASVGILWSSGRSCTSRASPTEALSGRRCTLEQRRSTYPEKALERLWQNDIAARKYHRSLYHGQALIGLYQKQLLA